MSAINWIDWGTEWLVTEWLAIELSVVALSTMKNSDIVFRSIHGITEYAATVRGMVGV